VTAPTDDRGSVRSVLEEERDFFVRSLRDLEAERAAGDIDDLDYRSLRDDYTIRAADVLRRLETLDAAPPPAEAEPVVAPNEPAVAGSEDPDPPRVRRRASPRRRVLTGVAAVVVVVGSVTGAFVARSGSSGSATTRVRNLDVAALDALGDSQYTKAVQDYEAALRIDPTDVQTLTGEGELLVEIGSNGDAAMLNLGMARLQSAELADPSYAPAFGARGLGYYDQGNYAAAIPQLEVYLADTPAADRSAAVAQDLATAKKKLAAKGS
jgi:tetratricopeptide (TPR) repeat protein